MYDAAASSRATAQRWEFAGFHLDEGERRLLRGGREIPLPPKDFDLLVALVRRAGRLVRKEELLGSLWRDVFVEEGTLPRHVSALRKVLSEHATEGVEGSDASDSARRDARFLETVPKVGYRWIAATRALDDAPAADATPSPPPICRIVVWGSRELLFPEGEVVIGRDESCGVPVDSPLLSRRHARITVAAGRATIEDLRSKNGTRKNGELVTGRAELHDGDEIRLGTTTLYFHWTASLRRAETETHREP
jgi:DNA-binding winged helix-turn-helix (wHTH) protein